MNTELPNPDYSKMCDRDLCIELSKYDAVMKKTRPLLADIEREAVACREAGTAFERGEELGTLRTKFIHAVRQIVRVKEQQHARGAGRRRGRGRK